jgi:hypothetical protein
MQIEMLDFYCMFKGCVNELPVHPACLTLRHKTAVRPAAINYHLKAVVFPAEMKEFPHKLFLLWVGYRAGEVAPDHGLQWYT